MSDETYDKVLIVANSAENLMEYNHCLEDDFEIRNSPTLDSTLDLIDDFEPNVVVIDEHISNSSAIEIAEAIRGDHTFSTYTGIVVIADPKIKNIDKLRENCVADNVIPRELVQQMLKVIVKSAAQVTTLENRSRQLAIKLEMTEETVKELKDLDSITKLYSLPHINDLLEQEFQRSKIQKVPLSIIMTSIDNFMNISHSHGPKDCIKIIQQLSDVLRLQFRGEDYLGRSWGGEFIGILPETNQDGALVLAERLKEVISSQTFGFDSNQLSITVSQGIAVFSPQKKKGFQMHNLLLEAEANLSAAKQSGNNYICFDKKIS